MPKPDVRLSHHPGVNTWLLALAVFALSSVVFSPATRCDFVNYDDDLYVYANPTVNRGLTISGVVRAFTQAHARNWHPLTTLSHMLDCQLFGLNPSGHHAVNVLLHGLAASTLFLALYSMTGVVWRPLLVAMIFAVHPLRVESVAWISERKDVLSALVFACILGAYANYARRPRWPRAWLVIALFAAGLMAKPMLVTLPLILILLDFWPLRRFRRATAKQQEFAAITLKGSVVEKLPLLLLSAASCVVTVIAAHRIGTDLPGQSSLAERLADASLSYCVYIFQLFWPKDLAVFYPLPLGPLPLISVLGAVSLLLAVTIAAIALRTRIPYFFVGWFWYLIMLLPVAGIFQIGLHAHADRYTYLSQIGLLIAIIWGLADTLRRLSLSSVAPPATAALVAFLGWRSWNELRFWQNSESLWNHALAITRNNDVALNNLAGVYESRGELERALEKYREALRIAEGRVEPRYAMSPALLHNNIGNVLARKDDLAGAMDEYRKAIALRPDFANAHANQAEAYVRLGDWSSALGEYENALHAQPRDADVQHRAGTALLRLGRREDAIAHYRTALEIDPQFTLAEVDLGNALLEQGHLDEAAVHYRRATEIDPQNLNAHFNLGSVFLQQHRLADAIAEYQKLIAIQPRDPEAHLNFANALAAGGSQKKAIVEVEKALELAPDSVSALNNLAWLLAASADPTIRDPGRAVTLAERAAQLAPQPNALIYHTLAAAYASAGETKEAITAAERCHELALANGDAGLADAVQRELEAYRNSTLP